VSTLKTDAITAVTTNGDLRLDGLGTGGVSIASTLKMAKGGDIASASPLVIDTDGNYFDVTGTTNFAAMTVEAGNFFMLQFDGALTITHGSGIELPGAANLTTAAGDRLVCYATAANTVEVMSVELETAASAGGLTLTATQSTASGNNKNFGSIPAGTKQIILLFEGVSASATGCIGIQIGDSGGIETSGYQTTTTGILGATPASVERTDMFTLISVSVQLDHNWGTAFLTLQNSSTNQWAFSSLGSSDNNARMINISGGGKALSGELTQVQFYTLDSAFDVGGSVSISYQ
jgi:hypothetical protein